MSNQVVVNWIIWSKDRTVEGKDSFSAELFEDETGIDYADFLDDMVDTIDNYLADEFGSLSYQLESEPAKTKIFQNIYNAHFDLYADNDGVQDFSIGSVIGAKNV